MQIWRSLCLIQFCILIVAFTYLGLTPHPEESIPMFNDKLMHSSGYLVAGMSISFAFPLWKFLSRAIFLIVYSIGIEIGQHFLPPRTFDLLDICANSSGVLLGLLLIFVLQRHSPSFTQFLLLSQKKSSST